MSGAKNWVVIPRTTRVHTVFCSFEPKTAFLGKKTTGPNLFLTHFLVKTSFLDVARRFSRFGRPFNVKKCLLIVDYVYGFWRPKIRTTFCWAKLTINFWKNCFFVQTPFGRGFGHFAGAWGKHFKNESKSEKEFTQAASASKKSSSADVGLPNSIMQKSVVC